MMFDRRITGGLAWAGLGLVVAVPVLDFVSSSLSGTAALPNLGVQPTALTTSAAPVPATAAKPVAIPTVTVKPMATAPTKPAVVSQPAAPAVASTDPVQKFQQGGKTLPSYISDGADVPVAATETPAATVTPAPAKPVQTPAAVAAGTPGKTTIVVAPDGTVSTKPVEAATQIAAVDPATTGALAPLVDQVAPIPMPASMRPKPRPVDNTQGATLILDQNGQPVRVPVIEQQPMAQAAQRVVEPSNNFDAIVGSDDLADWESGPLSEFLAKRRASGNFSTGLDENSAPVPDSYQPPPEEGIFYRN